MSPRQWLRRLFDLLDAGCERIFPDDWNPLHQLGALGWFFFWIVVVSGVYLYIFFDTGVTATYQSIEAITHTQWWAGGVMRSLHRYASDALVVVTLAHLLREFAHDRMRGNHWFAWFTGVPLLLFIYVCGISGYWLVWDTLAQYVAIGTSQLLDVLPIFGIAIARNFVDQASLSDRFFTLMVLIHIAAPLLMLLAMWIHISRHARARVNPALGLGIAVLGSLLLLSLADPALSQPPANLDIVPAVVELDWFYLPAYPLAQSWGGAAVWWLLLAALLLLTVLPWLPPRRTPAPAVVDLANCNGCGRCFADCPFGAIALAPRSDGLPYEQQAAVNPAQCMSCGICVGSCPTATPFRTAQEPVAGIELPYLSTAELRRRVQAATAGLTGSTRVLVFGCAESTAAEPVEHGAAVLTLPCVGMLPPSFVDFVLARGLADGVMLAGCAAGDCYHRLGDSWTEQRMAGARDPRLRDRVPRERVALSWAGRGEAGRRRSDLAAFRESLASAAPMQRGMRREAAPAQHPPRRRWPAVFRWGGLVAVLGALAVLVGRFDNWPAWRQLQPGMAVVTLSFRHAAKPIVECKPLTPQEMMALKPNMRRPVDCPRARWPVYIEFERDGKLLYRGEHAPAGLWQDGPSTVLERFPVAAGRQQLTVRLRDSGRSDGFDYVQSARLDLVPEQNLVVDFRAGEGFVFH